VIKDCACAGRVKIRRASATKNGDGRECSVNIILCDDSRLSEDVRIKQFWHDNRTQYTFSRRSISVISQVSQH
jgi:hypothetical protein